MLCNPLALSLFLCSSVCPPTQTSAWCYESLPCFGLLFPTDWQIAFTTPRLLETCHTHTQDFWPQSLSELPLAFICPTDWLWNQYPPIIEWRLNFTFLLRLTPLSQLLCGRWSSLLCLECKSPRIFYFEKSHMSLSFRVLSHLLSNPVWWFE